MLSSTLFGLLAAVQIGAGYDANIERLDRGTFKSAMYSFEDAAELADFKAEKSKLSQSDLHFKRDAKSLLWDFQPGGSFAAVNPEALKLAGSRAGGLKFWVYSPAVQPGVLKIEGVAKGRAVWTFEVKLGFKGWRAVWLMPSQDAKVADKKLPPLDAIRFVAATAKPGTLFFDRFELIDNVLWVRESDFQSAINPAQKGGVDQTLATYRQKPPADTVSPSPAELAATKVVVERLRNWINGSPDADRLPEVAKLRASMVAEAPKVLKEFEQFKIVRHPDGRVTGQPLFATTHAGAPPVQKLIDSVLLPMTLLYCYPGSPAKPNPYYRSPELLEKIVLGLDHANDQGWAEGSAMGSCYGVVLGQSGYNLILFLLRDELAKAGILDRELKTLRYYSHFNELFTPTEASADKLRSVMFFQLLVIASLNDPAEQTRFLRLYTAALNRHLATMRGVEAFIKPDGTVYHHSGPYWMGYGMNGLEMASRLGYFLRETPFALNAESRDNLKKAFLTSRFVAQKYDFPISLNGRWPLWGGGLAQGVMGFGYAAQLFNPIDPELAAAWKRLGDFNAEVIKSRFAEIKYQGNTFTSTPGNVEDALGFGKFAAEAEKTPQGHLALPYAGATFHRRGETLAAIKGNSNFIWDYEKESCGQLGRYLGRGSITIYPGSLKNAAISYQGWDFAHIPGATAPVLPPEKLEPGPAKDESRNYTNEGAVGGMAFGENGAWMMRFADATYDKTFGFDQSAFAVGDTIVVLGNAIRSADAATPVHTTLFQHILPSPATATTVDGKAIAALPLDQEFTGPATFRDSAGIGFAIPAGVKVRLTRDHRNWPDNAFGRETGGQGDAEMAVIDHGKAPQNGTYEYAILLNGLAKPEPYQVLRRDRTAHIVAFPERKITVYAVFNPDQPVDDLIEGVSEPALIAIEERDGKRLITACGVDFGKNFRPKGTAREWFRKSPETPLVNAPNQLEIKLKGSAALKLPAVDGAAVSVSMP